jgi:hypothetical protein
MAPLRLGTVLNPTVTDFADALSSEIFVDKTELISLTNKAASTSGKFICISRPRRFGKSVAAHMLVNYYSLQQNNRTLFDGLNISKCPTFEENLNKYNVIFFDVQTIFDNAKTARKTINQIKSSILSAVIKAYPDVNYSNPKDVMETLSCITNETNVPFIFIIDEWDCLFRAAKNDTSGQILYLNFLRSIFKGQGYVHLAYMTGMLPIKKYGTHSALNMFKEYSMEDQNGKGCQNCFWLQSSY